MCKIYKSSAMQIFFIFIATLTVPAVLKSQDGLFDLNKLTDFGTKQYKMTLIDRRSGKPVEVERGTMVLAAAHTKDSISLKNTTRMYLPDGKRFIEYQADCIFSKQDEKMNLRSLNYKITRSDKVVLVDIKAKIENGKITQTILEADEKSKEEKNWTDGTYPDLAVFFLIPQLSQKKGKSYEIDHVMTLPFSPDTKATARKITCLGIDKDLKIDGQEVTRFVNKADGEETGIVYWVDSKGRLLRVQLNPENRLDLITKKND